MATSGGISVIPAGNNNIGDVDVATLPATPAGSNITGSAGGLGINVAASFTHIAATAADVQGLAALANRRLLGYSVTEAAGTPAAAEVTLRHGTLATDPEIGTKKLALSTDRDVRFGTSGIAVPNGVFVDMVAGTVKLTLIWSTVA